MAALLIPGTRLEIVFFFFSSVGATDGDKKPEDKEEAKAAPIYALVSNEHQDRIPIYSRLIQHFVLVCV